MRRCELGRIAFVGWHIFLRDFKIRYRRTALGFFWSLAPLVSLGTAVVVFAQELGFSRPQGGAPYPVVVVSGLIVWQAFSESFFLPQQLAKRSLYFLVRTPVPYESLLVASAIQVGLNLVLKLPVLAGLLIYYAIPPAATAPLSLIAVAVLLLLGLGLGALLAPASLVYLDVRYAMPFLAGALLVATPVFYALPESGPLRAINLANPLTHLVLPGRDWLLGGQGGLAVEFTLTAAAALLVHGLCLLFYRRSMRVGMESL
ncbi:MAG: ABC transporter permease [Thermoanaerobaculia bacterium]